MILNSIKNLNERFDKYKHVIMQTLIDYYGYEYANIIKDRFNHIHFIFSSTPKDDYKFAETYNYLLTPEEKKDIELKYDKYLELKKELRKEYCDKLIQYIENEFNVNISDKILSIYDTFLILFTDPNFNEGLMDSYTTESYKLLNDPSTPNTIRNNIIDDQKHVRNYLEIRNIDLKLSKEVADKIKNYRDELRHLYRVSIANKSEFGNKIKNEMETFFGININPELMDEIAFRENPWAGILISDNKFFHPYIQMPLTKLINYGSKGLDVHIIHEIIHKIETNEMRVGIEIKNDDVNINQYTNEIRTQLLAIKITKQLHELGIFIFDDPNNYSIKDVSIYDKLFPLTELFFEKYEELFKNCAINNTPEQLEIKFGSNWNLFSSKVDEILYKIIDLNDHYIYPIDDSDKEIIENLIDKMNYYSNSQSKKI